MGNKLLKNSTFKVTFQNYQYSTGIVGKVFIWKDGRELYKEKFFRDKIKSLELATDRSFIVNFQNWQQRIQIDNSGDIYEAYHRRYHVYDRDEIYHFYMYKSESEVGFFVRGDLIGMYKNPKKFFHFVGMYNNHMLYMEEIAQNFLTFVLRYPNGSKIYFREAVEYLSVFVSFKMLHDKVFILYGNNLLVYLNGRLIYRMMASRMIIDECGGLRLIKLNGDELHCTHELKFINKPKSEAGAIYIPLKEKTKNKIIKYIHKLLKLIKDLRDIVICYLFELY